MDDGPRTMDDGPGTVARGQRSKDYSPSSMGYRSSSMVYRLSSAAGAAALATAAAALTALGLLALFGYFEARSLRAYYTEAKYQRDDYRGLAATIAAAEQPGDAIILNAPGQAEIFGYYYQGAAPIYPLPAERPPDRAPTEQALERLAGDARRVWLVLWAVEQSDPDAIVESWLDRHAFKARSEWYGSVRLALYTFSAEDGGTEIPLGVEFERGIRLDAYRWVGSGSRPSAPAGGILNLQLRWLTARPIDRRYVVFAHLIDDRENIWGHRDS